MFDDLLETRLFILEQFLREMKCPPFSFRCSILGHRINEWKKKEFKLMEWQKLSDGFEYKELVGVCGRCWAKLNLYQYPRWPDKVLAKKDC